jgi:hypothetical protein
MPAMNLNEALADYIATKDADLLLRRELSKVTLTSSENSREDLPSASVDSETLSVSHSRDWESTSSGSDTERSGRKYIQSILVLIRNVCIVSIEFLIVFYRSTNESECLYCFHRILDCFL